MREEDWEQTIEQAARLLGWLVYHTYDSRHSAPGFPDLCLVRPPRLIFAELKTEAGQLSRDQRLWLDNLAACPMVETYVWRPSDWRQVERVLAR